MLETFASLVVDELELRLIATRDALTGALSRRAFLQRVGAHMADRRQPPSTLAILDVDHFKSVNDRFGHPAGDTVLKQVVAACSGRIEAGDAIGRIGGEEFGILFAHCDLAAAHVAAERLRAAVAALGFDIGNGLRVTASFGLAELNGGTIDNAMAEADAALYVAKRDGRNRCVSLRDIMAAA